MKQITNKTLLNLPELLNRGAATKFLSFYWWNQINNRVYCEYGLCTELNCLLNESGQILFGDLFNYFQQNPPKNHEELINDLRLNDRNSDCILDN